MTNKLKERLEALSAGATQGEWFRQKTYTDTYIGPKKWGIDSLAFVVASFETHQGVKDEARDRNLDNAGLIVTLVNAYRSGDLITRQELDEAVATEREACAHNAREYAANYPEASDGRNTLIMLAEQIESNNIGRSLEAVRARSEQKEG